MATRILMVDDEAIIRDLVKETLGSRDYAVTLASDGAEALEILEREEFDLVITDVVMPRLEGPALLKAIKHDHPLVHVIVLTGYPRNADIGDLLLEGADDVLAKPFRGNDLLAAVRRAEGRMASPREAG